MPGKGSNATLHRRYGGRRSGRSQALGAIPLWPGNRSLAAGMASRENATFIGAGSLSYIHAQRVWIEMREATAQRGGSYRQGAEEAGVVGVPAAGGMAQLGFLSLLSQHLLVCQRCWTTGRASNDRPVEWLTWSIAQCGPGLRDAFGAVWRDAGGEGLPVGPPSGVPRG